MHKHFLMRLAFHVTVGTHQLEVIVLPAVDASDVNADSCVVTEYQLLQYSSNLKRAQPFVCYLRLPSRRFGV
jgi:hypothetical protein